MPRTPFYKSKYNRASAAAFLFALRACLSLHAASQWTGPASW